MRDTLMNLIQTDVVAAAPALLGCILMRGELWARIVETEAYRGEDDPACHAHGRTQMKNMAMFGPPGRAYVYFTYGNHWMLNVVCQPSGSACAVLIRAAEPLSGIETMRVRRSGRADRELLSGPGKLAQAFDICAKDNACDLFSPDPSSDDLVILAADHPVERIANGVRIGMAKGKGDATPWRFADAQRLEWVSRPQPKSLI